MPAEMDRRDRDDISEEAYRALLHAHDRLHQLLQALLKLSDAQQHLTDEDDWHRVLARKQELLDALGAHDLERVRSESMHRIQALTVDDHLVRARELTAKLTETHRLLVQLVTSEQLAIQRAESQVQGLNDTLRYGVQQTHARHSYQAPNTSPPARFFDGHQ